MTIAEYINQQPVDRHDIMTALHDVIVGNDKSVTFSIEPMMGKDMMMYKQMNYMKYALASVKKHLSLHCLPMYMNPAIHAKYEALLPAAKFQKGCINFSSAEDISLETIAALITDCSEINIADVLEKRKRK
jgi:hypothetical protein